MRPTKKKNHTHTHNNFHVSYVIVTEQKKNGNNERTTQLSELKSCTSFTLTNSLHTNESVLEKFFFWIKQIIGMVHTFIQLNELKYEIKSVIVDKYKFNKLKKRERKRRKMKNEN